MSGLSGKMIHLPSNHFARKFVSISEKNKQLFFAIHEPKVQIIISIFNYLLKCLRN